MMEIITDGYSISHKTTTIPFPRRHTYM